MAYAFLVVLCGKSPDFQRFLRFFDHTA